uniref:Lipoprotein n=1 Tax=Desulfobacca acetoxidans TaxID=60893 RepID=A0A7C3Z4Z0_9BACT
MKPIAKTLLGIILLVWLLASGCATETAVTARTTPGTGPDPFYRDSWWGTDPVCSPGCPPGMPPGGY